MQTGSSGTLIGWKSGQTTYVPLWTKWSELYGLRARIPRGDFITAGWSKSDFVLEIFVWPMSSSATSTSSQSGSCMGRWIPFKPVWTTFFPPAMMECRLCLWPQVREKSFRHFWCKEDKTEGEVELPSHLRRWESLPSFSLYDFVYSSDSSNPFH
jgi:hypothetical protein